MSLKITIAAIVSASALIAACATGGANTGGGAHSTAPHSVPFVVLHNGFNSGFTRLSEFVIRDNDEFTRRWRGVTQGSPDAVKPDVNFEKTTVVFAAIGSRNTGGYTVKVDSVISDAMGATVHYTVKSPGARCMSLQELTSPLEVISFDHLEGEIKFKRRNESGTC